MCRFVMRFAWLMVGFAVLLAGCNLRQSGAPTDTPFPTPDIPRIRFMFPENNSSVVEGTDLAVEVLAEDSGAGVAKVQLIVDEVLQGEGKPEISSSVPAFSVKIHWVAKGIGLHSLRAVAFREDGKSSDAANMVLLVIQRPTDVPK